MPNIDFLAYGNLSATALIGVLLTWILMVDQPKRLERMDAQIEAMRDHYQMQLQKAWQVSSENRKAIWELTAELAKHQGKN